MNSITIRPGCPGEADALAALDSARPLEGDIVVAEVDGELVAALAADGRVVADPFRETAQVVELLRTHAAPRRQARRLPRRPAWAAISPANASKSRA